METVSALLALCAGYSPVTGEFSAKRPVTWSFDVFFICAWINGWVKNREAGDLRRHSTHYEVIVMVNVALSIPSLLACGSSLFYEQRLAEPALGEGHW